jgi:putative addiction module killer protein
MAGFVISPKELRTYRRLDGSYPFRDWFTALKDVKGQQIVLTRLDRLCLGNPGVCRHVGDGIWELKIDFGPGYRVYFGYHKETIVILLSGGDKRSQVKDILAAKRYWADYWRRVS